VGWVSVCGLLQIKEIERINAREADSGIQGSWHDAYDHSAFVYIGGLSYKMSEGDVIAVFSQYGEPNHVNLVRDKVCLLI
jgi:RNA-binding motif X-linked protein 2